MLGQDTKQREPWAGRVKLGQRIVTVDASEPPAVRLTSADGYRATMNVQRLLDAGKIFEPLRGAALFQTAHSGDGLSSPECIAPGGGEIDLCAEALRMEAEGVWDPVAQEWKV